MPKFTKLNPNDVTIGRGRAGVEARKQYTDALRTMEAGRIELQPNEKPSTVKRHLQESAKSLGIKVRSAWVDERQRALVWKKTSRQSGGQ